MLTRLQQFAIRLRPARHLLLVIAAMAFCGAAYTLVTSRSQAEDLYFIPLLALFAWALMLYAFAMLFLRVPPMPEPGVKFLARVRVRLQRSAYWILAVTMLGVSGFLLLTTWQLATTWRMTY